MEKQIAARQERGVTVVEYALLIAGVLLMSMMSLKVLGSVTADEFATAGSAIAFDDAIKTKPGGCPNGWDLTADTQTKKKRKLVP